MRNRLFPGDPLQQDYIEALQALARQFVMETELFPADLAGPAGEYLFQELILSDTFAASRAANRDLGAADDPFRHAGLGTGARTPGACFIVVIAPPVKQCSGFRHLLPILAVKRRQGAGGSRRLPEPDLGADANLPA